MNPGEGPETNSPAARGLLGETRVRLLDELCGAAQTAAELASKLGVSANGVRVHLEALRTAGLVAYDVERRGVGKPRHVYSITTAAEYLLSAAYAPTLNALLKAAEGRLNGELPALLRAAGDALFHEMPMPARRRTVRAAADTLASLGRPVKITKKGETSLLTTQCCPLGAVSSRSRHICSLVEAMLTSASGMTVRETCDRGDQPRCRFRIDSAIETA